MLDCEVSVDDLAARRDVRVIDLRPRAERWVGMGVIPGSVSPQGVLEDDVRSLVASGETVVLACATGRRSLDQVRLMSESTAYSLHGGLLAWRERGLPAIGVDEDLNAIAESRAAPPQLHGIKRALVSCFVAEVAETSDDPVDPVALLNECSLAVGVDPEAASVGELLLVVEEAAARSRALGVPYERIVKNVSMFLDHLRPLARAV